MSFIVRKYLFDQGEWYEFPLWLNSLFINKPNESLLFIDKEVIKYFYISLFDSWFINVGDILFK